MVYASNCDIMPAELSGTMTETVSCGHCIYAVFKTNGRPVIPGNQKLGWAVKFEPGQVKITIDCIRREIFWTFLGD